MTLLLAVAFAQAQTANDEMTKEINRTIELLHATNKVTETLSIQLQPLVDQGLVSNEKLASTIKELEKILAPVVMKRMIAVYKENFTLAELKQMNAYFASPVGQKYIKLSPVFAQEGIKAVQAPEIQSKVQSIIMDIMQK
jgi:hypothetical protein